MSEHRVVGGGEIQTFDRELISIIKLVQDWLKRVINLRTQCRQDICPVMPHV